MGTLTSDGYEKVRSEVDPALLEELRSRVFAPGAAGTRCLLDDGTVQTAAANIGHTLVRVGLLPDAAVAIQAIAFDKTAATNWKVTWHQDLMFPFARRTQAPGYDLAAVKDGVNYARPPVAVLDELLAVRLHLDPCGLENGPLRVSPGSHRLGIIRSIDIPASLARSGEAPVCAATGELLLHASSKARAPAHRRVLHLVYCAGFPGPEDWHRALAIGRRAFDPART